MKHYLYGGSTAKRQLNCTAWTQQCEGLPSKESDAAKTGTAIHWMLEQANLEDDFVFGDCFDHEIEGVTCTEDMVLLTEDMWNADIALCEKYDVQTWGAETTATHPEFLDEEGEPLIGSTIDKLALGSIENTPVLIGTDYKSGAGVQVEAIDNSQLLHNFMCMMYDPELADLFEGVDNFIGVIIQPGRDGNVYTKEWPFTRDAVKNFEKAYLATVEDSESDDDLEPVAGDHCNFCSARGLCDATTGQLLRMAQLDPEDLEQVAWGLGQIEAVKATIKAIEEKAYTALELGQEIKGWKLVRGKAGNTSWNDADEAFGKLKRVLRAIKNEDGKRVLSLPEVKALLQTSKTVTPTQAKKILKSHKVDDAFMDDMTFRPEPTGHTLAPESDKRDAILSADALAASLASVQ